MTTLGYVFNKALNKNIPVKLLTNGPDFWRPSGAISQEAKNLALAKTKAAFEGGELFKDVDIKTMELFTITYIVVRKAFFGI